MEFINFIEKVKHSHSRLGVVISNTGSGKSTKIPTILANQGMRVIAVEPTIASCRMLHSFVEKKVIGKSVGFAADGVRNYNRNKKNPITELPIEDTRLIFCTTGFIRRGLTMGSAPFFDCLILDEFHDGNADYDVILALWKKLFPQKMCLVLSATFDSSCLANFDPLVHVVPSMSKSVTIEYAGSQDPKNPSVEMIDRIKKEYSECRIKGVAWLAFCPGENDVNNVYDSLKDIVGLQVIRLFRNSSTVVDDIKLIQTDVDKDKVRLIVATNIVETGVTIPHLVMCFDSMNEKRLEKVPNGRESKLVTKRVTKSSATQRLGRLARGDKSGYMIRFISEKEYSSLPDYAPREKDSVYCDWASLVLFSKGVEQKYFAPYDLGYLESIGCIEQDGEDKRRFKITDIGKIAIDRGYQDPRIAAVVGGVLNLWENKGELENVKGILDKVGLALDRGAPSSVLKKYPGRWFEAVSGIDEKDTSGSEIIELIKKVYCNVFKYRVFHGESRSLRIRQQGDDGDGGVDVQFPIVATELSIFGEYNTYVVSGYQAIDKSTLCDLSKPARKGPRVYDDRGDKPTYTKNFGTVMMKLSIEENDENDQGFFVLLNGLRTRVSWSLIR